MGARGVAVHVVFMSGGVAPTVCGRFRGTVLMNIPDDMMCYSRKVGRSCNLWQEFACEAASAGATAAVTVASI